MEDKEISSELHKAILGIVTNQRKKNDPPETNLTFKRLVGSGISQEEAVRLIGCAVAAEIFYMSKEMKPFNIKRFIAFLNNLPETPFGKAK